MKNKIATICLLMICIYSGANAQQQYQSCFGKESTKWIIVKPTSYWGIDGDYSPKYYLIDSIKCYGDYKKEQPYGVVYFETDGNSKLWRWNTASNEKSIIMDLNWEVGDSIFIDNEFFKEYYEARPFGIVDSVFYDENNRKIIHTDLVLNTDRTQFNLKYIEGIGPNASVYLEEYFGFFWRNSHMLLCAYKDDIQVYVNVEVSNDCTYKKPESVETIQKKPEAIIKFNYNTIELMFDDTFSGKLCLIAANGQVVKKVNVNCKNKTIDIKEVPDGFYIIQVTNRTGKYCVTQKITKSTLK